MHLPPPPPVFTCLARSRSHDIRVEQLPHDEHQPEAARCADRDSLRLSQPSEVLNQPVYTCTDQPENAPHQQQQQQQQQDDHAPPLRSRNSPGNTFAYNNFQPHGFPSRSPQHFPSGPTDTTLVFESRFEGGNLHRAVKVYEDEYDLILRPDINTRSHAQWFFFSISNTRQSRRYKLNIVNLAKNGSLHMCGKRPVAYSSKENTKSGTGWYHCGDHVCHYANHVQRKSNGSSNGSPHQYYTLSFIIEAPYAYDTLYLANCVPFTPTTLHQHLREIEACPRRSMRLRRRQLCKTLAGNRCDLLTITTFTNDDALMRNRRAICITSRVHPGESSCSWVMKGIIDFLTGGSPNAKILRDSFIFKIVPLLNSDGCVVGNQRCNLAGVDLNRVWDDPSMQWHPTIYYTKMMIKSLANEREIALYLDLHGHSRRANSFMFGCPRKRPWHQGQTNLQQDTAALCRSAFLRFGCAGSLTPDLSPRVADARPAEENATAEAMVFPKLVERAAPNTFNFNDCSFDVTRDKRATARVTFWRELSITNSFTLEVSLMGPSVGSHRGYHYTIGDLEDLGESICEAILQDFKLNGEAHREMLRQIEASLGASGTSSHQSVTIAAGESDSDDNDETHHQQRTARQQSVRRMSVKKSKTPASTSSPSSGSNGSSALANSTDR